MRAVLSEEDAKKHPDPIDEASRTESLDRYRSSMEWESKFYRDTAQLVERTCDLMHLDPNIKHRLLTPQRALIVTVPARMDDGSVKNFIGYRVQHNNTLGPYKGGIRYHPEVNLGEVSALAMLTPRNETSAVSFIIAMNSLPVGGMITRNACGRTTLRIFCP